MDATSLLGQGVRSVVCVPLMFRGAARGVLYLDHKGQSALFREGDLQIPEGVTVRGWGPADAAMPVITCWKISPMRLWP